MFAQVEGFLHKRLNLAQIHVLVMPNVLLLPVDTLDDSVHTLYGSNALPSMLFGRLLTRF